jgi:AsmA family
MKLFRRILLVVVLLLVIAGVAVYFYLDTIVKHAVERQSTNSLNLTTTLDSARLSLLGGKVNLHQLDIASPQGFSAPHMFELGQLGLEVSYGQLRQDPVRVSKILIDQPKFVLEQNDGKMNFKAAMDQLPKGDSAPSDPNAKPVKVIIDELTISNATIDVRMGKLPGLGEVKPITVSVPSLTLKNIGNADNSQNGAAIKDVVMQVATALSAKVTESGNLPEQFKSMLQSNLTEVASKLGADFNKQLGGISKNLQDQIQKAIPGDIGKIVPDVSKALPKEASDPGKAIGDLLGGNKDKDKKKDNK